MSNILNLINQKESMAVQFEESFPSNELLIQTAIAFSNCQGGNLFVGIDKNGAIKGLDRKNSVIYKDEIYSLLFNNCFPHIIPDISTVNIEDKFVLFVHFNSSMQKPHYYRSKGRQEGTYIRTGARNKLATPFDLEYLEMYKRGLRFELLSNSNIKFEISNFSLLCQHVIDKLDMEPDIKLFEELKLIKKDNDQYRFTNLGILFSDIKNDVFDSLSIHCNEVSETNSREMEINDDLLSSIEKAISFIQTSSFFNENNNDLFLLIKEILLNSIIHRDYSIKNEKIEIEIRNNKISIFSPGLLGIKRDYIGQGVSASKNLNLHNILSFFGFAMNEATGFNKIKSYLKNFTDIKVLINECENGVEFIVNKGQLNDPEQDGMDLVDLFYETNNGPNTILEVPKKTGFDPKNISGDPNVVLGVPNNRLNAIVSNMKGNCKISSKKLSEMIGVSEKTIKRDIEKMKRNGIVRRVGEKRNGYWEIIG